MASFFGAMIKSRIASKMGDKVAGKMMPNTQRPDGVLGMLVDRAGGGSGPQPMGQMQDIQGGAAGDSGGYAAAQGVLSQNQRPGPTPSNMGGLMMSSMGNPYMNREQPNWRYRSY